MFRFLDLGKWLYRIIPPRKWKRTRYQGNRAAWAKREGETFYPLNEKFTSLMYFITKPTVAINSESGLEGYMIDKRS